MSAVTDSYNAERNVWQIVVAPAGYYIYRVMDKKLQEFRSFVDKLSSIWSSMSSSVQDVVNETSPQMYADTEVVSKEILDAAMDKQRIYGLKRTTLHTIRSRMNVIVTVIGASICMR